VSDCEHKHLAEPAPGKTLRVCLDCAHRIIECASCPATVVAGPDVGDSGWLKHEAITPDGIDVLYQCPACQCEETQ
jgi:hypothetical protein